MNIRDILNDKIVNTVCKHAKKYQFSNQDFIYYFGTLLGEFEFDDIFGYELIKSKYLNEKTILECIKEYCDENIKIDNDVPLCWIADFLDILSNGTEDILSVSMYIKILKYLKVFDFENDDLIEVINRVAIILEKKYGVLKDKMYFLFYNFRDVYTLNAEFTDFIRYEISKEFGEDIDTEQYNILRTAVTMNDANIINKQDIDCSSDLFDNKKLCDKIIEMANSSNDARKIVLKWFNIAANLQDNLIRLNYMYEGLKLNKSKLLKKTKNQSFDIRFIDQDDYDMADYDFILKCLNIANIRFSDSFFEIANEYSSDDKKIKEFLIKLNDVCTKNIHLWYNNSNISYSKLMDIVNKKLQVKKKENEESSEFKVLTEKELEKLDQKEFNNMNKKHYANYYVKLYNNGYYRRKTFLNASASEIAKQVVGLHINIIDEDSYVLKEIRENVNQILFEKLERSKFEDVVAEIYKLQDYGIFDFAKLLNKLDLESFVKKLVDKASNVKNFNYIQKIINHCDDVFYLPEKMKHKMFNIGMYEIAYYIKDLTESEQLVLVSNRKALANEILENTKYISVKNMLKVLKC